jgi:putative membrane protein
VIVMMWWNGGQWYWAMAMMVLFWGAVVAIVYFAVRRGPGDRPHPSARELLDERFARGELSEDEYARKRAALEGRTPAPHG